MSEFDPVIIDSGPSERGWSYYSKFIRCPMLFYWKHVYADAHRLGWNDYTYALARGTLVHVGLAHHYARQWARENEKDEQRVISPIEAVRVKATQIGDIGEEMRPVAEEMLAAYFRTYPVETFRVVAVEEPVSMYFGAALYTARLDLVVEHPDRRIYIYDAKTTARMESKTLRKYTLHGQFFGQNYLGRKYWGDRFGGVIVNAIDESGNCVRHSPSPAPFMFRKFPEVIENADRMIFHYRNTCGDRMDDWPASPDEQICFGPYGQCPAFELCRWGHGGSNGTT